MASRKFYLILILIIQSSFGNGHPEGTVVFEIDINFVIKLIVSIFTFRFFVCLGTAVKYLFPFVQKAIWDFLQCAVTENSVTVYLLDMKEAMESISAKEGKFLIKVFRRIKGIIKLIISSIKLFIKALSCYRELINLLVECGWVAIKKMLCEAVYAIWKFVECIYDD